MDTIERNGRTYQYDPDFDVYRPQPLQEPLAVKWLWLVLLIAVTAACVYRELA